jgi:NitT/TauT family transport system substrate-binding protein
MPIVQSRRRLLTNIAVAGATCFAGLSVASLYGGRKSAAAQSPPEVSTIRIDAGPILCVAPEFVADSLLHAEGFTEIRYDDSDKAPVQKLADNVVDWILEFAPTVITESDSGVPVTMVSGVHAGCFELFAQEHIHSVAGLKGRTVGVAPSHVTPRSLVSIMASYVGLNPETDIHWVRDPSPRLMQRFIDGNIDAFLTSAPRAQELRARGIGHSLVNSATDRPWSQYYCCMLTGRTEFIRKYPVATKRVLRAILKGADLCAAEPERTAQLLVDQGRTARYDYALQALNELSYKVWRDYDPEDTVRWYALRLNEGGFIRSTPDDVIANRTDWRFLNQVKRELRV